MKKAAALSLETIAVAAIILVVLIIVLAVFRGGIDKILPSIGKVNECEPQDQCVEPGKGQCASGQEIFGLGCDKEYPGTKTYCCKRPQEVKQN